MFLTRFLVILFTTKNLILPNVLVNNIDLSKLSQVEAVNKISQQTKTPKEIKVYDDNDLYSLESSEIQLIYNFEETAKRAMLTGRDGNIIQNLIKKFEISKKPLNIGLIAEYDQQSLEQFINIIDGQIGDTSIKPSVEIKDGKVLITNGNKGYKLNRERLKSDIYSNISRSQDSEIKIELTEFDNRLTSEEINLFTKRVESIKDKNLKLTINDKEYNLNSNTLVTFLDPKYGFNYQEINKFIEKVSLNENKTAKNPKFIFLPNQVNKVTEFEPSQIGIDIDKAKLSDLIISSLINGTENINIPHKITEPEIKTGDTNNLGINEVIGKGYSTYFHSIPGRVHNVGLASEKINGYILAPNETFSFNDVLGDVSKYTGYKSAYVILNGKTVLGDGGGVCQVSSTLFRAVLNAGLPITQRSAHAYRVGYYEQGSPPGMDATVFSPSPDFKFVNDTGKYILISAKADSKNYSLVIELYGTKDGRISKISKPKISNQVAPGPDIYQDDPTLKNGVVKQVEYKSYGAKVSFDYQVVKDNVEIFSKTFVSNYRPWNAVYLRGTGGN